MTTSQAPLETQREQESIQKEIYVASPWRLMWWKFRDHRLAYLSMYGLVFLYVLAGFCEFISPYDPWKRDVSHSYAPPHRIRVIHEGHLSRPFVYPLVQSIDPETLVRKYSEDRTRRVFIRLFPKGDAYRFWGLFPCERHLLGTGTEERVYLMGADRLGRDLLSRILYGSRISLSIGLVGVGLSLILGIFIGGISGYYGGWVDTLIQRFIEILRSFPTIPLWMALSAAMPATWSQLRVYFCMTVILALIGWTGLARVVRGKILALREEDYAVAARVAGVREIEIILRHLIPGFASHLIVSVTLAIPGMIAAETSLSFLRLGLRPPTISWGVLLQDAQNLRAVSLYPWLLLPIFFVILTVLMFNFLGDGMRDAADPYTHG
ncbi:MAG TPA: ABC transporter permease [Candidatus Hydrogenedentes bacterium]|nr:ABC transporter permease [Candidatus Hydrogenedentota bacterium]HOL76139.1 ABC transporter permease [Candidatus Hydrogenedentota bacterium]HPO84753.1 ABC transporter permease [Candidatus Hydrogenedentota bacterium]